MGRWQPPQLVVQLRWQVKQAIVSSPCARSAFATPGPKAKLPSSAPDRLISLARAALALKCGLAGSTLSFTSDTSHSSLGSTMDRWISRCRPLARSEEHTSELQSLMRNSYAVFCLKKKTNTNTKI